MIRSTSTCFYVDTLLWTEPTDFAERRSLNSCVALTDELVSSAQNCFSSMKRGTDTSSIAPPASTGLLSSSSWPALKR